MLSDSTKKNTAAVLVTAIMPLKYYKPEFLQRSLDSLKNQSDPNWRLLIVVEASDFSFLEKYLQKELVDSRIKMLETQRPGFVVRMNTGMDCASTDFTALLFADDKWALNAVQILNEQIQNYPDIDFFHSSRAVVDEQDHIISPILPSKKTFQIEDFKWGSPVKHLLCWRRLKGLSIGGIDEAFAGHGPDDYDFPWSMAEHGANFKAIKECLYYYRNHCDYYRLTTHVPRSQMRREVNNILRKHGMNWWERRMIIWKRICTGSLGGQSLYRNSMEKWIKNKLGINATEKWTQSKY